MTDIATTASPARSIVFVDSRVQDAATLLQGLDPGTEVVFLQAGQDGLAQMAAALGDRGDVGAVQVIAHGSAGQLWLGSRFLDNTTLQQPEVQALLAALGRGLTAEGDLLIYACNTAEGSAGAQFVSTLAALTGADVAASDDRTGAGGDWDLEISTGSIEQATMLSAQGEAAYQHGLATLTVTTGADSGLDANFGADQAADLADGAGLSLREALHWAQNGDTVTFNANMTVSLSTKASADSLFILNKNLTIDGDLDNNGTADVTLDGQYKGRVLEVTTGTTAMLDGLVITKGLLAGNGGDAWEGVASSAADALGAGILNSGTLTVVNSTISANVATGGGGGGAGVGGAGGGGSGFNGIGGGAGGKQIYIYNNPGAPGGMGIGGGGAADTPPPSGSTGGSAGSGPYVTRLGGNGGTSTDGGLGGLGYAPYSAPAGGKGGKVTGAGGGGGGGSFNLGDATYIGGNGGTAAGAVHITSSGILFLANSTLSGNLGAGGGGGAGGVAGTPGAGGQGIGAIYNLGQLHYNAGTTTFTSNEGGGGTAGNGGAAAEASANLAGNAASSTTWTNDLPPTVTVTAIPANGTYKAGHNLDFTVTYNEAVTVNTAGGTPSIALTLDTGGTVQAAYIGGSTTNALTFRYTVAAGNLDANGIAAANSINLNGGTILDSGNNNAPTTGISFASTTGVLVDAVAPSVSSINRVGVATTNATSVDYTVTFSEPVTGVNAGDFTLISAGASGSIAAVTGSGSTYTVTVNGITGDGTLRLDLNNVGTGIADVAGNAIIGGYTSGQSYTVDTTAPSAPSTPDLVSASDSGVSSTDNITNDTTPTFTGTAETGSTVTLYADGMTALGSAVATGGVWTITSIPLSQGTHTVTAKATDAAGNVGAASAGLSVTIDTAAPTLTITSNVSTLKIGETATITFDFSEDPGASFSWDGSIGDVVVSGGTLSALSGTGLIRTATFTPSANTNGGTASITVASGAYTDSAGNSGGAGVTPALTFDTLAPAAPSAPDLATASDTGLSSSDNLTKLTTPTITGTAEAGATVTLYDTDGMTVLGTATTDGSGNWSITGSPLASGTHTLSAKATDAAGNVSSASAGLTVTVDANPPSKPAAPVLATASDVGQSNSDGITNLTSLTLQGAAGSVEANATVHARSSLDGGLTNTVANADGSWSLNVTGLAQGTHQLQINATDAAGNTSTYSDASTVVIDTTAPTLAITSNVSVIKTGETATITFDFSEDPGSTFTWDGNSGDVVVTGGTLSAISGTGATRTATFTPDANTNGGTASITVTAASYTDMAGNAGGAGTTPSLSFDTLGPSTTASGFAFSADNGASAIDLVTNQAAQTISGTLSAALVAGESVEVSLDNGSTWAMAAATVGSSTWSLAGQTLAGSDTLQARVKDAAGNTGASTSKAYVLDVTAPTFNPTTGSAPADDASAVPVSGSLVLSFSEALASLDSTKVYLKDVNTDTVVAATISINGSGKLVIQPTAALQNSTAYYVTWDANALKDLAGNAVVAVANETTYNFTTEAAAPPPPPPPPGDSDGVDAAEEDSVPGIPRSDGGTVIAGDGNGDGIKDSTQAEVTSLNFRQTDSVSSNPGAPKTPVTLVADSKDGQIDPDTGTAQITSISQKDAPADLPAGFSAPLGLLSFTAKIDTAGGTENFSFYVDASLDINGYYKQDASGTWINLASPENGGKVVVENGKTRLDFAIQDGGKFDADGKADGIITDPGAPGKLVQVTPECPYDPFRNDADKDQVPDAIELAAGTNVNVKDNNVFGNNGQWVNQLWRDLYGREGYGDSQATQLAQSISQGSVSKTQALAQVLSSQELDNHAGAVLRLFYTVLDRSPKMCGYNYWLGQANEGTSVLEIGRAFLNSAEFVQQYAGLDNSAFVDFLYKNALHRMPDAAGKAGWLQQLESGAMDRAQVLYGVAQSAEAKAVMSSKVAVDLLFLGLLNREPKAAGAAYWEGQYPAIGDLAQFMTLATGASAEYHDRFVPSDGLAVSIVGSTPGVSPDVLG